MAARQLVHKVLSFNPKHKVSKVIQDLVYEALQNHLHTFESSLHSSGVYVETVFENRSRNVFPRHSILVSHCCYIHFCHFRVTEIQRQFGRRNCNVDKRFIFRLDGGARRVEQSNIWFF